MKNKYHLLIPFFITFILGITIVLLFWLKKEEGKKAEEISSSLGQEKEAAKDKVDAVPTILAELIRKTHTIETPPFEGLPKETPTVNPSSVSSPSTRSSEDDIKGVAVLPTHPYFQPSLEDSQKTVEFFLEAAKEGNAENFKYFLNSDARRNESIHLVPQGWDGHLGSAAIIDKIKGDANTIKIIVSFYKGKDTSESTFEKIGYFLVKSFDKWLIFDTVIER